MILRLAAGLRDQRGYTMAELLVTTVVMGFMAAAAFMVYEVGQRTYLQAAGLEDAQANARIGADRLVRELRLVGAFVPGAASLPAITSFSSSAITFLADIDSDTVNGNAETVTSSAASGTSVLVSGTPAGFEANERLYIAYGAAKEIKTISSVSGSTLTLSSSLSTTYAGGSLTRSVETVTWTYNSSPKTVTRQVGSAAAETILENVTSFSLTYYDGAGATTASASAVREIKIDLTIEGSNSNRRSMSVRVRPVSLDLS